MSDQGPTVFKGRYELHRRLARGGMSDVYLARDQVLDRPVAVKVLFPEYAKDATFVERFRREAQAAARLNHPNVVAIYDWGEELGTYFIAMEYIDGRSLSEIIRADGPLPPDQAVEIAGAVAAALGFAHRNGVVHRDIKPGNVLVDSSGLVKVADFGIAQAVSSTEQANLTRAGSVMGTATYFSPEQAQGKQVDARTDVYSLGCVLFEMLATRPPFAGETPVAIAYKHVQEEPPTPSSFGAVVPPELEAIVMTCLAKDPADRYQSADDLRLDLRRFLEGQPVSVAALAGAAATAAPATMAIGTPVPVATGAVSTVPPTPASRPPVDDGERRGNGVFIGLLLVLLIGLAVALFYIGSNLSARSTDTKVTVPTVVQLAADEATRLLTEAGFTVNRIDEPNDQTPSGVVFAQDPKGQTSADAGSAVEIRVSTGAGDLVVPNVVGSAESSALSLLQNSGFEVITEREPDADVAAGLVKAQSPAPETKAVKGSKVIIVVSTGAAEVEVPDVTGQTATAAANRLGQLGFKVDQREEFSGSVAAGRVIATNPKAGTEVEEGSTVTLLVSAGPEQTTTTSTSTTTTTTTTTTSTTTTTTTATSTTSSSTSTSTTAP